MDNLQWFKFNPSKWFMGRIQRCPEITQSRFIRLCCLYWSKDCKLSIEDAEIEIDKDQFKLLLDKKVVSVVSDHVYIDFLSEQFNEVNTKKDDQSEKGKIGNLKRWHPDIYKKFQLGELSLDDALMIAKQSGSDNNPIANDRREDKREKKEEIREEKKDRKKTLEDRKTDFKEILLPYKNEYSSDLLNEFFSYWTEHGPNDKKMRFEKEKSFDPSRRLSTWKSRQFKFNGSQVKNNSKPSIRNR